MAVIPSSSFVHTRHYPKGSLIGSRGLAVGREPWGLFRLSLRSANATPLVFGISRGITNQGRPCQVPQDPRDRQTLELPAELKKPTHQYRAPWRWKAESFQEAEDTQQAGGSDEGWRTQRMLAASPPRAAGGNTECLLSPRQ